MNTERIKDQLNALREYLETVDLGRIERATIALRLTELEELTGTQP